MAHWPIIIAAGLGVGMLMGIFGVGGSSVATPILALLGAPGLIAIASPLPATIPTTTAASFPYLRAKEARPRAGPAQWFLIVFGVAFTAYRLMTW